MSEELNEQMLVRRQKLNEYREKGIDPFGKKFNRSHTAQEIFEAYESLTKEDLEEKGIELQLQVGL